MDVTEAIYRKSEGVYERAVKLLEDGEAGAWSRLPLDRPDEGGDDY